MATNYNITMKQFNGTDYDNLYPAANLANSIGTLGVAHGGTGVTSISALQTQLGLDQYAKIQTGSYTGTGTYGSSNPNSLTFSFSPDIVGISSNLYIGSGFYFFIKNQNTAYNDMNTTMLELSSNTVSYSNNGISWYSSTGRQYNIYGETPERIRDAKYQFNAISSLPYYYVAIGK